MFGYLLRVPICQTLRVSLYQQHFCAEYSVASKTKKFPLCPTRYKMITAFTATIAFALLLSTALAFAPRGAVKARPMSVDTFRQHTNLFGMPTLEKDEVVTDTEEAVEAVESEKPKPFLGRIKRLLSPRRIMRRLKRLVGIHPADDDASATLQVSRSDQGNGEANGASSVALATDTESKEEEEDLMQKVKDSGLAGVISYAAWELAFWLFSIPVALFGYKELAGHWPDFSDKEDMAKLGAEAFAFVNFARFAVPLRLGLALSTTEWVKENIVDIYFPKKEDEDEEGEKR